MSLNLKGNKASLVKIAFLLMGIFSFSALYAQVNVKFEYYPKSPMMMNVGDSTTLWIKATVTGNGFDSLFLKIQDQPQFLSFQREETIINDKGFISNILNIMPKETDGGQYLLSVIAGGIHADGTIEADTLIYDLRVKPFIFNEPEYSGTTSNTISWMKSDSLYDQWIYIFDSENPGGSIPGNQSGLGKTSAGNIIKTTFENLQNNVKYGFYLKGFTADSAIAYSDTVYSIQDTDMPEFLSASRGHEAPDGAMDLYWQNVSDPTSYVQGFVIFRRKGLDPFVAIDTVMINGNQSDGEFHYYDTAGDLQEGIKYYYKIAALDAGLNVGDGQEIGPFVPDATPPGNPVFDWKVGSGFDYELGYPVDDLPNMGYHEKTWYKKGKQNQVFVFNPENQPGFTGLAKADSVRFQAVRDSSKFFNDEWQPGMQFFEKWFSQWISVEDFAGKEPSFLFDFTSGGNNDDWFVHGHFYKYRAQFKDIAGNRSDWSRINTDSLLVGNYQDVFAPKDISNLNIFVEFDPAFAGGGYFRIEWEKSTDPVSGVQKYNIYRKIGEADTFRVIGSVEATDDPIYKFNDPFANVGVRAKTSYRITSVDHVGNERDVSESAWEVSQWPPLPPTLVFEEEFLNLNNQLYTNKAKVGIAWPDFDVTDVAEMYVYVNGDSQQVDPPAKRFDVTLVEGDNQITAKTLFANGIRSPHSNQLHLYKDATPPTPVLNLAVKNDSSYTGNISLDWSASQDLLPFAYLVFRKENGSSNYQAIDTTRTTQYFDPYLQKDGTVLKAFRNYEYKILPQDTLGNSAEQNAGMGSTYCNIAATIQRFSFSMDTLSVFWQFPKFPDSSAVALDSIRFDVKLFQDSLPQDYSIAPAYRVDYVIGKTQFKFSVEAGPKYFAVVQAVDLTSANLNKSAWSLPRFSDTGLSIIPTVDSLLTQVQPLDTTGIFVSWERYWDNPFWTANGKDLVGKIKVMRWKENEPQTKTKIEFLPSSPEFIQSGWMDKGQLEADAKYVYQVIPFEIKVNDPPRLLPAGNSDAYDLNDTSVVINYVDRVFIPKLNNLYAKNPATGKKYFSYPDPTDSLRLEWFWLYKKNAQEIPAAKEDFRGAERIKLFVANNPGFENLPDYKKFVQVIEINRKDLANDDLFSFSYVSDLTNQSTFNLYEGKSLFLKIMGFDQWGHDPAYPSSAELDGVTEMVLDNTPPPDPGLSFHVKSSIDTTAGISLVDIRFTWSSVADNISGLRNYSILVTQKDQPDSVVLEISNIFPTDTSYTEKNFEIKDEYFEHPLIFKILPKDYAGNVNFDTKPIEFSFFNPPTIIAIERDPVTNKLAVKWTKVPAADKYLFVFANQKSYFLDENLRDNPGNREEVIAVSTDPDTIMKTLNKYYNPDSTWYFRVTAIKSDIFESGWSDFFELVSENQSGGSSPVTSVAENNELPETYRLFQNYPNPFNPETTIEYDVPNQGLVEVSIYNLKGEKIQILINQEHQPGHFRVKWNGRNQSGEQVASGMYLYILAAPNFKQVGKCLLLK